MGADVVATAGDVWSRAHMVLKVKEPLIEGGVNEFELMKGMRTPDKGRLVIGVVKEIKPNEGRAALLPDGVKALLDFAKQEGLHTGDISRLLFTYFHFAASHEMTEAVLNTNTNALTLEAIVGDAKAAALFNYPEWINSEGEPGRIVVPKIVKLFKERLGDTLVCLDPMSIVAGIESVLQAVVYLDEYKVKVKPDKVIAEQGWVDSVLDKYPDSPDMKALEGKTVLITGAGTAGLSALWQARRLGAKVIISDMKKNLPLLLEISGSEYSGRVALAGDIKEEYLAGLLEGHDIIIIDGTDKRLIEKSVDLSSAIIGAALVPRGKAPRTVTADIIKRVSESSPKRRVMIDISIDQGGNLDFINADGTLIPVNKATYHSNPVRHGYKGLIYYQVGNMPGRPGVISKAASRMLQAARLPYVKALIKNGLVQAVAKDKGLMTGISVVAGELTDEKVANTPGFGFTWRPVTELINGLSPLRINPEQKHSIFKQFSQAA
jgi:alanine dehydrogenase